MGGIDATLDAAGDDGGWDASDPLGGRPMPSGIPSAARPGAPLDSGETDETASDASEGSADDSARSAERRAPSYDEDSDTFRRQICEAARKESDPELRGKLENECRRFGGAGE
jgi:hypothetical protein